MTVKALLSQISTTNEVRTIGPKVKAETAAALLHEKSIGALPVVDDKGKLIGIFTERDIVALVARRGAAGLAAAVEEAMTKTVLTMTLNDSVKDLERLMNTKKIRHIPILEGETLRAIVSIRDVVKYRLQSVEMEKNILRDVALARQ
jgi:CBS domain-containing protein